MTNRHEYAGQRDDSCPGWDQVRKCEISSCYSEWCAIKIYELVISGIFHLIFSDYSWQKVTEAMEIETSDKGGL